MMNTEPSFVKANGWTVERTRPKEPHRWTSSPRRCGGSARTGLSLTEVARRAGIAKSTLSQLESGTGNPSVETLWALGVALGVPFGRLVDPPGPQVRVIRAGEGPITAERRLRRDPARRARRARAATCTGSQGARAARASEPHMAGTVEHLVVGTGRMLAGPAGAPVELGPGDYLVYPGDVPHVFEALEPRTLARCWVSEHP